MPSQKINVWVNKKARKKIMMKFIFANLNHKESSNMVPRKLTSGMRIGTISFKTSKLQT